MLGLNLVEPSCRLAPRGDLDCGFAVGHDAMMRMGRRSWHIGIAAVLLALGWTLFTRLEAWSKLGDLRLAQQEIAGGQLGAAHRHLAALAARPGALGGAADYWPGICEALSGRPDAALRAFARLPEGYAFDPVGAYHEAKANLNQGKLHAAERRLEQALARGGPGLDQVRDLLGHIYACGCDDAPVLMAWIDLARGCGRPDEALDAARQLGPGQLDFGQRLALRALISTMTFGWIC